MTRGLSSGNLSFMSAPVNEAPDITSRSSKEVQVIQNILHVIPP